MPPKGVERVTWVIRDCRTEVLGGLQWQCVHCDHQQPRYHSCRDRHCPQCQHRAMQAWTDKQQRSVLPVNYYHLVFTLPHDINPWIATHGEVIYRLLFQCAWDTLKQFAHDPRRLDGQPGMTAVLHTWGQNLSRHVHLHGLVLGGVLTDPRIEAIHGDRVSLHYKDYKDSGRHKTLSLSGEEKNQRGEKSTLCTDATPCPRCHQRQWWADALIAPKRFKGG